MFPSDDRKTNHLNNLFPSQMTFDVNVLGPISLTRLLAPHMLKRGRGHFVVVCHHVYAVLQLNNSLRNSTQELQVISI